MEEWRKAGHGGINADEMGLGKTCQAIVALLKCLQEGKGPFLVISPLSVVEHWHDEVVRFGCGKLKPVKYVGYMAELEKIAEGIRFEKNSVFLCPYHIFKNRQTHRMLRSTLGSLTFSVVVVDEAQHIKNADTLLARGLKSFNKDPIYYLLTGTPIQNNLSELYSLLNFADSNTFPNNGLEDFLMNYDNPTGIKQVTQILKKYMVRRTKKEVFENMKDCHEVVLYHDLSSLQKRLYIDIISKNEDAIKLKNRKAVLTNVVLEIRKCAIHPYLFRGVEPEPFEEGEHLVESSGKLQVLDRLLRYLKDKGHRCLLFSFFKLALNVVEDFLILRGWNYVRIDGECNVGERVVAVNSFQKGKGRKMNRNTSDEDPWIFMSTTKTGGVGLNLTAADTIIFLDTDWNPQNDIQAMARCHRIGQDKRVRVIRLVARYTVEQYMLVRAREKLRLSDEIMENQESALSSAVDLAAAIKSNFDNLMDQGTVSKFDCKDEELERIVGETKRGGEWAPLTDEQKGVFIDVNDCEKDVNKHDPRFFQGVSYRISEKDDLRFQELLTRQDMEEVATKRRRVNVDYKMFETFTPTKGFVEKDEEISNKSRVPLALRIEKTRDNVAAWLEKGRIDASDGMDIALQANAERSPSVIELDDEELLDEKKTLG